MDGYDPAALREEYLALVLATIQRYAAGGHALVLETAMLESAVRVSFDFDPNVYGDYFAQMGAAVAADPKAQAEPEPR